MGKARVEYTNKCMTALCIILIRPLSYNKSSLKPTLMYKIPTHKKNIIGITMRM